jgi:ribonuclease PH
MIERSPSGRGPDALRPVELVLDYLDNPLSSCLISMGATRVLTTVSVRDKVPHWLRGTGKGWITAEYSMLPGATAERTDREAVRGRQGGRTVEIQRLIGRSLRSMVDLDHLGEIELVVDCDVLQADGGTRTASITGGSLALQIALERLKAGGRIPVSARVTPVAAVSVGIVDGAALLDLDYAEDARAEVDMNLVMTAERRYVEIQGKQ